MEKVVKPRLACELCQPFINVQLAYNEAKGTNAATVTREWFEAGLKDCQDKHYCMPLVRLKTKELIHGKKAGL